MKWQNILTKLNWNEKRIIENICTIEALKSKLNKEIAFDNLR